MYYSTITDPIKLVLAGKHVKRIQRNPKVRFYSLSGMKKYLDHLYNRYNRRCFVPPDPLQFLYEYENREDREIVALVASSLAYGRVAQIIKSIASVLDRMVPSPHGFLERASGQCIKDTFSEFRHRFTTGEELAELLIGIKCVKHRYGSLSRCFRRHLNNKDETVIHALESFTEELKRSSNRHYNSLLPSPSGGSACKRLNLFLRWMVRKDAVDPGEWNHVSPARLVVPLDTHMHRICRELGLTERRQADMKTALEITRSFKIIIPEDPVRYDFVLTRLGIRQDICREQCLSLSVERFPHKMLGKPSR
jgi:uncharacterized protein (TIGR02757 family)